MSTNHHTVIGTGAAANASVFNSPLSQLDAQITANAAAIIAGDAVNAAATALVSAEVLAARNSYPDLDTRLDEMTFAGSTVSTLANGAALAGQKVIDVDSTAGFLAGAPIAYTLVGGVIETNTVSLVNSTTKLTCTTNLGTGGIADDTYIAVLSLGSLVSTGAVTGATSEAQTFTVGIKLPTTTPTTGIIYQDTKTLLHTYGTGNVFLGVGAGNLTTTGSVLTGVGYEALKSVTSGIQMTAFGYQALAAATTGTYNQAIGYRALYRLVDGTYNVASGQGALEDVVNASYNTAMGWHCLQQATSSGNTAVGYIALVDTTTGESNTAFGTQAGKSNVTGSGNVFLGNGAGFYETASNKLFIDNTYRASEADGRAKALIYGVFDAAVANQLLTINGSLAVTNGIVYHGANTLLHDYGTGNIFAGVGAGNLTTTGSVLTGVGYEALKSVTTGIQMTAFGYQALGKATTGTYNQAIGYRALYELVDGSYNVASGQGVLEKVVSASYNTGIGYHALKTTTTGGHTAVGYIALENITTGENNTAFGCQAGNTNTTGSGNVFLGFGAGFYETASNKLFIDNTYRASEADGRAKALIYGVFDAAVANQLLTINADLIHTGVKVGFHGVTPIARALLATGAGATVDNVITALQNLGLVKQS